MEWSKENRLDLAQIGKKWPRLDPASRRNLNGLRLPAAAQAIGAFLLSRRGDGVVEASLLELQRSCAHAFEIDGRK
jgi:hypothetical protein